MSASRKLLVVDDESGIRHLLSTAFTERGYDVTVATNGDKAVALLTEDTFDAVITDLKMPGRTGMDVLRAARAKSPDIAVIVVTAYGAVDSAVEAMRLGAVDYVEKPFQLELIERRLDRALQAREDQPAAVAKPGPAVAKATASAPLVAKSESAKQLLKMIAKLGPSNSSVLITGPSGVGKELVARGIHQASQRVDKAFVALNCAALAPGVLESELFGHERGAFTGAATQRIGRFEKAHEGTLFLDEVGEIDVGIQTKLLRVLQEGEIERVGGTQTIKVDVRIIAATNRDLRQAIANGSFREDFYYRLNVFSLQVSPLRERTDDIPALVEHFLERFNRESGKSVTIVDDAVMDLFLRYPWPGNVRELENVMERAVVLAESDRITMMDIPQEMLHRQDDAESAAAAERRPGNEAGTLVERTDQLESELIYNALERFRWNKTKTADHLGLKRTTLQYKIKKYGLE